MDVYVVVKTLHILSATVLFGTGAGIAYFMLTGHLSGVAAARRFAAGTTVRADTLFTLPAVIIQPLSGAWLVWHGGFDWTDRWLMVTYGLYLLAGACWLPVVAIQMRMKALLEAEAAGASLDEAALPSRSAISPSRPGGASPGAAQASGTRRACRHFPRGRSTAS